MTLLGGEKIKSVMQVVAFFATAHVYQYMDKKKRSYNW